MPFYSTASALSDFDVIARGLELLETACGADEVTDATLRHGVKNVQDRIAADFSTQDLYSIVRDLASPVDTARTALVPATLAASLFGAMIRGYQAHLGALGTWLEAEDERVHHKFGEVYRALTGQYLSPTSVVFPAVTMMGNLTRGASASTYTDENAIDIDITGGAQLEVEVPAGVTIGGANWVLTLTCLTYDGDSEQQIVTVTSGATAGTKFDVGTAANVYTDVTAVTATGGTSGDHVHIQSKLLRSIASACS